jgi:membrane protein DedA with SNARE-associated domain
MHLAIAILHALALLPPVLIYFVMVAWLAVEIAAVPVPNEAILLFSGFLVSIGHLDMGLTWIASVVGALGGASLPWWVARSRGRAGVRRIGRHLVFLLAGRAAGAHWRELMGHYHTLAVAIGAGVVMAAGLLVLLEHRLGRESPG